MNFIASQSACFHLSLKDVFKLNLISEKLLLSTKILIDSIVKEIGLRKDEIKTKIESIYFGGGTPSLLCKEEINLILTKIRNSFNVSSKAECTLECNPENVNINIINDWKNLGINRVSLGIQSFNDNSLKLMNRSHNSLKAFSSLELLKNSFKNFSIDLIYGIPHSN